MRQTCIENKEVMKYQKLMEKAYPQESSPDFYDRIYQNWQNLKKGRIKGKDCYASMLYRELKPKRGKIRKFAAFVMYLILCLERPWEKEWKLSLSIQNFKSMENKINKILKKIPEDFPDLPDPKTLRRFKGKKLFKWKVHGIAEIAENPEIFKKLNQLITFILRWKPLKEPLKKIDFEYWNILVYLHSQRHTTKRDLYKKLRINSQRCNSILKKAEKQGFIKIKKHLHESVWITWIGPKE